MQRRHPARPAAGAELRHAIGSGRGAWLHVVKGSVTIDGHELAAGDAAAVTDADALAIGAGSDSKLLLFDVRV